MRDPREIKYMIPLLEAESEDVRMHIRSSLREYCPFLEEILSQLGLDLSPEQQYQLHLIQHEYLSESLSQSWRRILSAGGGMHRLEMVLDFISNMQVDEYPYQPIGRQLDEIAQEYRRVSAVPDPIELSRFLFLHKGYRGARDDYDNPLNSNLCYVINEKKGIPISLTSLFILVSRRLGLKIDGVNLPGHFLAKSAIGGSTIIFDCYNEGRMLTPGELAQQFFTPAVDFVALLRNPPTLMDIAKRVLRNLNNAYDRRGNLEKVQLVEMLLEHTEPQNYPIRVVDPAQEPFSSQEVWCDTTAMNTAV